MRTFYSICHKFPSLQWKDSRSLPLSPSQTGMRDAGRETRESFAMRVTAGFFSPLRVRECNGETGRHNVVCSLPSPVLRGEQEQWCCDRRFAFCSVCRIWREESEESSALSSSTVLSISFLLLGLEKGEAEGIYQNIPSKGEKTLKNDKSFSVSTLQHNTQNIQKPTKETSFFRQLVVWSVTTLTKTTTQRLLRLRVDEGSEEI